LTGFRADVEGLRAVAIVGVVAFHARIAGCESGFIGVDVFFVLSGFLICRQLLNEIESEGGVTLGRFWARRVRRLAPAATCVYLLSLPLALWRASPLDWAGTAWDFRAAALYFSNLRFAIRSEDYFAGGIGESFFLSSWSLSIEEQFYLVWPLALAATAWVLRDKGVAAKRRGGLVLLAVGVVVSFALGVEMTRRGLAWAFFSSPARSWEFAVGGLVAAIDARMPRRLGALATGVGVTLLVSSVFVVDEAAFPGVVAALPVGGTALLLLGGGTQTTVVQRLLATAAPRAVGRISYAWYLTHWPALLAFDARASTAGPWRVVAGVVVGLVAAILLHHLVENPLRFGQTLQSPARAAAFAAMVVVGAVVISFAVDGLSPVRRDPHIGAIEAARHDKARIKGCESWRTSAPAACVFGAPARPTKSILVIGDSHAMHWMPAIDAAAASLGVRVLYSGLSACPAVPVDVERKHVRFAACTEWHAALPGIFANVKPDLVIAASSANHLESIWPARAPDDADSAWRDATRALAVAVAGVGAALLVVHDTPHFDGDPLECLARHARADECSVDRAAADRLAGRTRRAEQAAGVAGLDGFALLCPRERCLVAAGDGTPTFWDDGHLTQRAALGFVPEWKRWMETGAK
jgi:peptidoglycan/LPS O-acetylase OafA/YrhL